MYGGNGISPVALQQRQRITFGSDRHEARVARLRPRADLDEHVARRIDQELTDS